MLLCRQCTCSSAAAQLTRPSPALLACRTPVWGTFFAVKDNVDVAGFPTTAACPAFKYDAAQTAPAVQALLDAGAICVGKLNMDQFAAGLNGTRTPYGTPANALDPRVIPGAGLSMHICSSHHEVGQLVCAFKRACMHTDTVRASALRACSRPGRADTQETQKLIAPTHAQRTAHSLRCSCGF